MRDPQQFPKHLLIGVANGDRVIWRIQRSSDMAICARGMNYTTDDGIDVYREPHVREWLNADAASAYLARLEDGTAGVYPDSPVVWVEDPPFFTTPPPMHADGPL